MGKDAKKVKAPGEIVRLELTVTISVLMFIGIVALTVLYVEFPNWQPIIRFSGSAAGIAAGILSAFYVGRGLRITIEQRDSLLRDDKVSIAFKVAARWSDPNLVKLREQWRNLLKEMDGKTDGEACNVLVNDAHKKTVAADVLNLFEEISFAARCGYADMDTLKNILRSVVVHHYSTISPWIDRVRRDKRQPTAYEHFEWLRNQWK
jgi:hypothetical protein